MVLGLSALVGLEREYGRKVEGKRRIMGIRSFILTGLLGYLAGVMDQVVLMASIFFGVLIIAGLAYITLWLKYRKVGTTTFLAVLVTFVASMLIAKGNLIMPTSIMIIMVALLAIKTRIMKFIKSISKEELISMIEFAIISLVILPFLPNRPVDPFGIFNPFRFWLTVVLVSLILLITYLLMKRYSYKGLYVSAFFGGIINSAATVYLISSMSRKIKGIRKALLSSTFIASGSTLIQDVLTIAFVLFNYNVLKETLPAQLFAIITLITIGYLLRKRAKGEIKVSNPFSIVPALKFAVLLFVLMIAGYVVRVIVGPHAFLAMNILASTYTSTAVIISAVMLNSQGVLSVNEAALNVIVASIVTILMKPIWMLPSRAKKDILKVALTNAIVGCIMLLIWWWL